MSWSCRGSERQSAITQLVN